MSIVTLTLQWGPITRPTAITKRSKILRNGTIDQYPTLIDMEETEEKPLSPRIIHAYDFGWRGQINGLTQPEREQFLKALPISGVGRPSEVPDAGAGISSKLVMEHLHNSGEVSREEMPMDFVFEYLKILVQMNYRVVASHAQNADSNDHCSSAAVWTLQKDENRLPSLANALGGLL